MPFHVFCDLRLDIRPFYGEFLLCADILLEDKGSDLVYAKPKADVRLKIY